MECNKLLFKRMAKASERPDYYLVLARSTVNRKLADWQLGLEVCRELAAFVQRSSRATRGDAVAAAGRLDKN